MTITKRFFAYGCSFTHYAWPTWADILGRNYKEYYNYGRYGAGNGYIFNALMETDQHHKITKNDLVIIEWSCSSREDRYIGNKWQTPGGVANYYTDKELMKFFDFRGFVIRDLAMIKAAKKFLDAVGCEYYFLAMVPFVTNNMYKQIFDTDTTDVAELYKDVLASIKPSFEEVLGEYSHRRPKMLHSTLIDDSHPLPTEHYDYIAAVLPELLLEPRTVAEDIDAELANIYNTDYQGWTHIFADKQKGNAHCIPRL